MTYTPLIPTPADLLSQSQGDIQTNFNQANVIMGTNHVNFNNSLPVGALAADRGKHTQIVTKRDAFAAALPVTAADEGAIYTKEAAAGGRVEAYYRYPSNGPAVELSLIKAWGRVTVTAGGPTVVDYGYNLAGSPVALRVLFTTPLTNVNYAGFVQVEGTNVVYHVTNRLVNQFDISGAVWGGNRSFYVIIVGN